MESETVYSLATQEPIVEYRKCSLSFLAKPTWEQAESTVNTLLQIHRASGVWLGDCAVQLQAYFPQTYFQFFPDCTEGELPKTIRNKMAIAKKIPPSRRRDVFPSVVDVAAGFDEESDQDYIISLAADEGKTVSEIREIARGMKGKPPKPNKVVSVACPECNHVFDFEIINAQ